MTLDILLPFWGNPDYLFATVESVLAQDCDSWRLIVVDDQYPDDRVPEYFEKLLDTRVTYLRNEVNLGITDNYRRCLELATEDYLLFLGCDDIMHPNYVSTILRALEVSPDVDMIQPEVDVIDADGEITHPLGDRIKNLLRPSTRQGARIIYGESAAASLLNGNWLYWPSITFRRETLLRTPFRDGFPLIQDLALEIDILAAGGTLLVEPTRCFSYRRHESSASSAKLLDGSRFEGERRYFEVAAEVMSANGWRSAELAAKLHLTSRLYALSLLPEAIRTHDRAAITALLTHCVR